MNKKYLLKRQKDLKAQLVTLEERAKSDMLTRDDLNDIETQVEEITEELNEINDAISELSDEDVEELEDTVEDLEDATDEIVDTVEKNDDTSDDDSDDTKTIDESQRSRVLGIIGKGISSRGEEKMNKLSKRNAFLQFLGGRVSEQKARSLGVDFNNGRVLVPQEIAHEVISYAQEENPLRKFATVHNTKGTQGFPIQVAKMAANNSKKERDEKSQIPFTEIEFDDYFLDPTEIDALTKITKKLTHMSDFDVEAIVLEELKKAYVRKEVFMYIHDTTNKGALVNKAVAFDTKENNKYLKLIQLKNALPTALRGGARWLINRAAQTALESLLDTTGNPILKESGNDDFEFKLLTYPVEVSDHVDGVDPSIPVIYFGNFSYFHIQDVIGSLEIQILTEKYADTNQIGYKIYNLTDGQLVYGPFETPVYSLDITKVTSPTTPPNNDQPTNSPVNGK
ncbi:phage major capsid protein [Melissococcus plutonius]|uniref:phage major capsid protein n=1 Tax=Melissococcus plutonius TaxID=33970 RepID=UPI0021E585C7|nr:phage major capsid protein [Melissococcus plutonius]MCV2499601.1 phage major capsid protein [Melissococcus plutonius]MCV2501521.1 phage major capsid protein [Melissococcus plutonius]MCV2505978.1 phage major capsid protein [Melissococcus plutonius]MCV2508219.1 phage major capsid protein [Melissococcus plutonius]MCV2519993.1 phage major capsid protein [Melissococcus plutonius]